MLKRIKLEVYYYYYYYYYYYRISHFSLLAGKYSPILGFSNQKISLGGLIYSLESFLQLNMCQELQIFAFVYMYLDAGQVSLDFVIIIIIIIIIIISFLAFTYIETAWIS
jgi:hypothetical protein